MFEEDSEVEARVRLEAHDRVYKRYLRSYAGEEPEIASLGTSELVAHITGKFDAAEEKTKGPKSKMDIVLYVRDMVAWGKRKLKRTPITE